MGSSLITWLRRTTQATKANGRVIRHIRCVQQLMSASHHKIGDNLSRVGVKFHNLVALAKNGSSDEGKITTFNCILIL